MLITQMALGIVKHGIGIEPPRVLRAVNLGDDADTTGAVCGQFAGAYWGESGIPLEWREGLARQDMVEKALVGLLKTTNG
jgi:ADP-ribosylglycohydrolase